MVEAIIQLLMHASMVDRQINLTDIRCALVLRKNENELNEYDRVQKHLKVEDELINRVILDYEQR